ncbi:MAG TPA: heme ABC transporter ATP-binding protein [Flavobacteriaceae bacterium]|nr:heme ABC transporter ATP-binding protein [Flavobacteriaceae bacterium]
MIRAKKISYAHRKFRILDQIDISVETGELMVIIGPNGAGKSTLLKVLAKESNTETDEVYLKEKKLSNWNDRELALNKAKFSQENNPDIGLLVKDIVLMGRYPYFHSVPHKKDWEIVDQMMHDTDVFRLKERNYNSLSGGEKQRVHLARVMAQLENDVDSKLAFFDEPLNNLDIRHQHRILEKIQAFVKKGNAAILVLHDLNLTAEFADKVLLLKKGKVVAHGKPDEIFTEETMHKAYDFPCAVCSNPITNCPMIIFGNNLKPCSLNF